MSVSVPCWRHCLSCRQLYFPSCQLTCAPPPSFWTVYPFSVLRSPFCDFRYTSSRSQPERVSASDVAGVTAAAHDCFRIVIINFSFISLGLSRQAPPLSSHLLRQADRPSASCSSASKYESPFVVPCSGGLSSSRAAVAMHLISSVHVVDFASPSKCLPCTPVLAQRLSLSATWPSYTNPVCPGLPAIYPAPNSLSYLCGYLITSAPPPAPPPPFSPLPLPRNTNYNLFQFQFNRYLCFVLHSPRRFNDYISDNAIN